LIQYGATEPREIVALLIVDDGVPDRGHRAVLFDRDFRVMGVASGPHAGYRSMCVITMAQGFTDREPLAANDGAAPAPTGSAPGPAAGLSPRGSEETALAWPPIVHRY
jgi:hypothetical protein